jgi:hypothetical protein
MHEQALASALSFDEIPARFPPLFRAALVAWKELPTLRPTEAAVAREVEYEQVRGYCPYFNPTRRDPTLKSDKDRQYARPTAHATPETVAARAQHALTLRATLAHRPGWTTVGALVEGADAPLRVVTAPNGELRAELSPNAYGHTRRPVLRLLQAYAQEWPTTWLAAIARAALARRSQTTGCATTTALGAR